MGEPLTPDDLAALEAQLAAYERAERRVWCGGRPDDAPCPWCEDEEDAR